MAAANNLGPQRTRRGTRISADAARALGEHSKAVTPTDPSAVFNDRRQGSMSDRRSGRLYTYTPGPLDRPGIPAGTPVRMRSKQSGVGAVKKPWAYVEHADTGEFLGMVHRGGLAPMSPEQKRQLKQRQSKSGGG